MLPFLFCIFLEKKITVDLVEVGQRIKDLHLKKGGGSLASEHAFYYHEDHFYILFTLM